MEIPKTERYVIVNMDTGTDDAWALFLLLRIMLKCKNIKLLAIIAGFGNTSVKYSVRNAYRVLNALNRTDIPIYQGANGPLIYNETPGEQFFGSDGMCDVTGVDGPDFPSIDDIAKPENAVEIINQLVMKLPNQVTIIGIGPLTTIALALETYPNLEKNIRDIFIMGGNYLSKSFENNRKSSEYNFFSDPEAAHIILNSTLPITILPWEAATKDKVAITLDWRFNVLGKNKSKFVQLFNKAEKICFESRPIWTPYDAILITAMFFPKMIINQSRRTHGTVELHNTSIRGQLILNYLPNGNNNVKIIDAVSEDGVKDILLWATKQC